jgi:universal stress protein A
MIIKNILFPTDFSIYSLEAVRYVVDLANHYGAKIHVLHVLDKIPPILTIRSLDLSEEKIVNSLTEEANQSLSSVIESIKGKTDMDIISIIKKGIDYEEIVNYSTNEEIDIIIIAAHGRTGILRSLIGSVTEKVVRYSQKPVLVVPPHVRE